jgi:hypothetical protein
MKNNNANQYLKNSVVENKRVIKVGFSKLKNP